MQEPQPLLLLETAWFSHRKTHMFSGEIFVRIERKNAGTGDYQ
jgi:hypothetical protein